MKRTLLLLLLTATAFAAPPMWLPSPDKPEAWKAAYLAITAQIDPKYDPRAPENRAYWNNSLKSTVPIPGIPSKAENGRRIERNEKHYRLVQQRDDLLADGIRYFGEVAVKKLLK